MTKKCKDCNEIKPIEDFYKRIDRVLKNEMSYCKNCFNRRCQDRWIKRKIDAILYKGGKCEDCPEDLQNSHYSVFEFHHNDRTQKDYDWTRLRLRNIKDIERELNKCTLLCANCHRKRHAIMAGWVGFEPTPSEISTR